METLESAEERVNKSSEIGTEDVIVISDKEEGEIIDASDLEDISTDEEILLRERIQILENYNNVLERKEAKKRVETRKLDSARSTIQPTSLHAISNHIARNVKTVHKPHKKSLVKRIRNDYTRRYQSSVKYEIANKYRALPKLTFIRSTSPQKTEVKKEKHKVTTKYKYKLPSSDSSDDDSYIHRNKRRKLQEAIRITSENNDKSSLKLRLFNMIHSSNKTSSVESTTTPVDKVDLEVTNENQQVEEQGNSNDDQKSGNESVGTHEITALKNDEKTHSKDDETMSEDDLESLRQLALQTKVKKKEEIVSVETLRDNVTSTNTTNIVEKIDEPNDKSECTKEKTPVASPGSGEDSDTMDLRLICLKSAVLKKAMERKRKQREQRRRSTASGKKDRSISTSSLRELAFFCDDKEQNYTDVESVDMDIGASDTPDEENEYTIEKKLELRKLDETLYSESTPYCAYKLSSLLNGDNPDIKEDVLNNVNRIQPKVEDIEEDEDILRAKLLNSLTSQNIQKMSSNKNNENAEVLKENKLKGCPNVIINLRESSDESDNENIKNLTKMHEKLKQTEFEQSLDLFLKNARKQAENKTLQEKTAVNENIPPTSKQTVKVVNHLPKSHQLEYKRLVKRMAELERVKQSRQASLKKVLESGKLKDSMKIKILQSCNDRTVIAPNITSMEKSALPKVIPPEIQPVKKMPVMKVDIGVKDRSVVLKDSKIYDHNSTESAITISRSKIAAEASAVMRLRAEAVTLATRARAAAAELRNARSALTLNRRALRVAQLALTAARDQHNHLLRSSINQSTKYVNSKLTNHHVLPSRRTVFVQPEKVSEIKGKIDETKKLSVMNRKLSISIDVNKDTKTVGYVQQALPKPEPTRTVEIVKKTSPCKEIKRNSKVGEVLKKKIELKCTEPITTKTKSETYTGEMVLKVVDESEVAKSNKIVVATKIIDAVQDYKSPLEAINSSNSWCNDVNAVFCPFEVEGTCKDADCKYVHPKNT